MLVCAELLMLSGPHGRHDAGERDVVVVVLESPADARRSTNAYRLPDIERAGAALPMLHPALGLRRKESCGHE